MSSTYSNSLRIELIGTGDQAGAWGATTDGNLGYILDTAIAGYQTVSVTSANQALTYLSGATSSASLNQSVYAMLRLTTTTTANFAIYAPPAPASKTYIIYNNSGYTATIYNSTVIGNTTAAGSGVSIADGKKVLVFSDGTNFYTIDAATLTSTLAIASGGTGQTTANAAFNALAPVQTNTVTAGSFVIGATYTILTVGTTVWTGIGASSNTVGVTFVATGAGSGTGTATTPAPGRYLKSDGTNTSWDQFSLASTSTVTAGSFVIGVTYTILTVGTTSFTAIGAASDTVGVSFTATGAGSGTGTAVTADYVGILPVISGGTGATTSTGSGSNVLSTSPTLVTPTISTYGNIKALFETATISAGVPTATTNFDVMTQAVQYYTGNANTNFTLNIRGDGSTTLNSILSTGQSVTIALLVTNGSTAYYPTAITIDGNAVTPKWQSGYTPASGDINSIDAYTFAIVKTASATFTVLGSQTKYA